MVTYTPFLSLPRLEGTRTCTRVIHVCGAPASGKTWLRERLSTALGVPGFSIDDARRRFLRRGRYWPENDNASWRCLELLVEQQSACIVETAGTSVCDEVLLAGRRVFRILCRADAELRRARLLDRAKHGYRLSQGQPDYVARLMAVGEPSVSTDAAWHAGGDLESLAAGCRAFLGSD